MIPAANPPLHTGQLLTSRSLPDGAKPNWAIVDFMPSHRGIEWFIEPVNGGERRRELVMLTVDKVLRCNHLGTQEVTFTTLRLRRSKELKLLQEEFAQEAVDLSSQT